MPGAPDLKSCVSAAGDSVIVQPWMSIPNDQTTRRIKLPLRFSLRSLFWLAIVIALLLSCFVQTRRLRDAEAVIARNSWAIGDAVIPSGKFRLLVNDLIDSDDMKVVVIRFEANEQHFITADGAGCVTTPNETGAAHWAEIRVVATYDSLAKHLTTLTQVKSESATAGGRTIYPLRNEQNPKEFMAVNVKPGIYDLGQVIELYRKPDGVGTLTVK
jgi:hypothetical protein